MASKRLRSANDFNTVDVLPRDEGLIVRTDSAQTVEDYMDMEDDCDRSNEQDATTAVNQQFSENVLRPHRDETVGTVECNVPELAVESALSSAELLDSVVLEVTDVVQSLPHVKLENIKETVREIYRQMMCTSDYCQMGFYKMNSAAQPALIGPLKWIRDRLEADGIRHYCHYYSLHHLTTEDVMALASLYCRHMGYAMCGKEEIVLRVIFNLVHQSCFYYVNEYNKYIGYSENVRSEMLHVNWRQMSYAWRLTLHKCKYVRHSQIIKYSSFLDPEYYNKYLELDCESATSFGVSPTNLIVNARDNACTMSTWCKEKFNIMGFEAQHYSSLDTFTDNIGKYLAVAYVGHVYPSSSDAAMALYHITKAFADVINVVQKYSLKSLWQLPHKVRNVLLNEHCISIAYQCHKIIENCAYIKHKTLFKMGAYVAPFALNLFLKEKQRITTDLQESYTRDISADDCIETSSNYTMGAWTRKHFEAFNHLNWQGRGYVSVRNFTKSDLIFYAALYSKYCNYLLCSPEHLSIERTFLSLLPKILNMKSTDIWRFSTSVASEIRDAQYKFLNVECMNEIYAQPYIKHKHIFMYNAVMHPAYFTQL